ncbi:MAG: DUF2225 domain-containing protein [Lachnospiraceae bacterium]|nr:DUF2225 domain-containing protein [Lachnospiraceae bacterium]
MADLLSGLESLGLGDLSGLDIYNKKESASKKDDEPKKEATVKIEETDFLFDKKFECPVCNKSFKTKMIRAGKVRLEKIDTDLRPIYENVDTLKYDAIVCPHCGYAALNRFFSYVTHKHAKIIKESISANFVNTFDDLPTYSYEDAIKRHKLALLNDVMKRAKDSEKAYTCLKLAWLHRGYIEHLSAETEDFANKVRGLKAEEISFLEKAYEGFKAAFTTEEFPMCGMDDLTVAYMIGDIARQLGKYEEAAKQVSLVLTSRKPNDRIKEKARDLRDMIKEEIRSLGGSR